MAQGMCEQFPGTAEQMVSIVICEYEAVLFKIRLETSNANYPVACESYNMLLS